MSFRKKNACKSDNWVKKLWRIEVCLFVCFDHRLFTPASTPKEVDFCVHGRFVLPPQGQSCSVFGESGVYNYWGFFRIIGPTSHASYATFAPDSCTSSLHLTHASLFYHVSSLIVSQGNETLPLVSDSFG